jgi:hypothetical protein
VQSLEPEKDFEHAFLPRGHALRPSHLPPCPPFPLRSPSIGSPSPHLRLLRTESRREGFLKSSPHAQWAPPDSSAGIREGGGREEGRKGQKGGVEGKITRTGRTQVLEVNNVLNEREGEVLHRK